MKKLALILFLTLATTIAFSQNNYWSKTYGPWGGSVKAFVKDSLNRWFVGISGDGVYYTTNEGNNWIPTSNGLTEARVNCLVIDSSNYLFAGTSRGLFRSSNGGAQWQVIYFNTNEILSIVVDQINRIFVSTANTIWISTDNGVSWNVSAGGLSGGSYYNLCVAPNSYMYVRSGSGVFRSTDGGANWIAVNSGLPSTSVSSLITTANNYIFAGISSQGVYLSTNNGENWTAVNSGLGNMYVSGFGNYENIIFAATYNGIFKTTNYGTNWVAANNGFTAPYTGCNTFAFISSNTVFAGTGALGVLKSTNAGGLWFSSSEGINAGSIKSIAVNQQNDIFVAMTGGVYKTTDAGASFIKSDAGITNTHLNILRIHPNGYLFVGTFPMSGTPLSGIFRSTNNGLNWTVSMNGFTYQYNNVLDFTFDTNGYIYAASNDNVYKSTNYGSNWFKTSNGITNNQVYSIAVNKSNNYIFAGTYGSGVFRSTDNGGNWTQVNNGLSATEIMSLEFNGDNFLFAGTNGQGVFRSKNNGGDWEQVLGIGLTMQAWKIAINRKGYIFAGIVGGQIVNLGIWVSTNAGDNWTQITSGIYYPFVDAIGFDSVQYGYAGTLNGGLYKSNASTPIRNTITEIPIAFVLEQNYPNPFNPTTTIKYFLAKDCNVKLKVYDLLGRDIETIVNGYQSAGYYQYIFDASRLSSGIYIYRLETDSYSESRRMILVR